MPGKAAQTFEELNVYQRALELTNSIYTITEQAQLSGDRGLVDQIRRASVSVVANIAERFERGTRAEFIQFLFIAKGSCGEVRALLTIVHGQHCISKECYEELYKLARTVSKMLSSFVAHLRGSAYDGEKTRRPQRFAVEQQQKRIADLRAIQEANMRSEKRNADKPKNTMKMGANLTMFEKKLIAWRPDRNSRQTWHHFTLSHLHTFARYFSVWCELARNAMPAFTHSHLHTFAPC